MRQRSVSSKESPRAVKAGRECCWTRRFGAPASQCGRVPPDTGEKRVGRTRQLGWYRGSLAFVPRRFGAGAFLFHKTHEKESFRMKNVTSAELRAMFLRFFQEQGHAVIASASVIPENDPTVLFTTAGMHPLVPYLLGAKHPMGTRLTDVQKCIRTGDIDEVGDASPPDLLRDAGQLVPGRLLQEGSHRLELGVPDQPGMAGHRPGPPGLLRCSRAMRTAPATTEAHDLWRACGVPEDHIFFLPKENNWWGPAGITGPCGPDTEMFIITDKEPCGPDCSPACSCGRYLEIWNDVFMQYNKQADGSFMPPGAEERGHRHGPGAHHLRAARARRASTRPDALRRHPHEDRRAVAARSTSPRTRRPRAPSASSPTTCAPPPSSWATSRGVTPSNVDQGYVLRRLIRRAVRFGMKLGLPEGVPGGDRAGGHRPVSSDVYPGAGARTAPLSWSSSSSEEERFQRTLRQGSKEFDKAVSPPCGSTRHRRPDRLPPLRHLRLPHRDHHGDGRASGA